MDGHLFVQVSEFEWVAIAGISSIVYNTAYNNGRFVLTSSTNSTENRIIVVEPQYAILIKRLLRMSAIGRTDLDFIAEV